MLLKTVLNSTFSRQFAYTSLTTAPQRRSLILIAFSSLCALGLLGLLSLGSLDLDFDFSVPVLDSKDTGRVHSKDPTIDACKFDYSAIDIAWNRKDPYISFIIDNELVMNDKTIALESIFIGKQICIIVAIPDSITNNSRKKKFSNNNLYVRASSENVIRIIPVFSFLKPEYENFYQGVGLFNYPGNYSLNLTIELPGQKDITKVSENRLSFSLSDEVLRKGLNEALPVCNDTSEIAGQWFSVSFYDSLHPFDRYSKFFDIDNEYIFVPDQCEMKFITPIEQLLCLKDQTIHAYGDEILWGTLFEIEEGYQNNWCQNQCFCKFSKFPTLSSLRDTPFANISGSMFGSSLFFHPIENLLATSQKQEVSWKIALKQISQIPKADIVIISVSNYIFMESKSLHDFRTKLKELLLNIIDNYPNSSIFVRTPEPFTLSRHIPRISRIRYLQVRNVTLNVAKEMGLYLWDVGILDGKDWNVPKYCVDKGFKLPKKKLWFREEIMKLESQFLFHSYCAN